MNLAISVFLAVGAMGVVWFMAWIGRRIHADSRINGFTHDDFIAAWLVYSVLLLELCGFVWGSFNFWGLR
jgi:hypothetical protein